MRNAKTRPRAIDILLNIPQIMIFGVHQQVRYAVDEAPQILDLRRELLANNDGIGGPLGYTLHVQAPVMSSGPRPRTLQRRGGNFTSKCIVQT